jgi:protein O-mannosyl-transferase
MPGKLPIKKKPAAAAPVKIASERWRPYFLIGVIIAISFFCFSPALKNDFVQMDDDVYVFNNSHLSLPLAEAVKYFFEPHYFSGNYIPLTMTGYALEYHAAGPDPQGYHTVNVILHILNIILVFWFTWLLSGRKLLISGIVALFFGIHPMRVESVAWVSELKDLLYSFFFICGLITYYKYLKPKNERSQNWFLVVTYVFAMLSVLSKPAAIVFPLVLLLLDFYSKRKFDKRVWLEKLPLFLISFIFGYVAVRAQQADHLINHNYPFGQRLLFASWSFLDYMVKLFFPVNLSVFYPYPKFTGTSLPYIFYVAPIGVALVSYGIYRTLKYQRVVAFGFLFFSVNLILVLQLIAVGNALMADRYTYIPSIGLFFLMAVGFDWLINSHRPQLKVWKPVAVAALSVFGTACCYITYARCQVWENLHTIAADMMDKFPDDPVAENNKGLSLMQQGKYSESVPMFSRAIETKPDFIGAYGNLAGAYLALHDTDNALRIINLAIKYPTNNYNFWNTKGLLLLKRQKYQEAIESYKTAIKLKSDNISSYVFLAQCYFALHDYNSELNTIDTALKYAPQNYVLLNNKGYTLFITGKYHEAIECFKTVLQYKPDYTMASINLENCYRAIQDSAKTRN